MIGNFLNVYSNYELEPRFRKKYFNNVVVKYDTGVTKKSFAYWDSLRPVPLAPEELEDFRIKDSYLKAVMIPLPCNGRPIPCEKNRDV